MEEPHALLQLPDPSQRLQSDPERLLVGQTPPGHVLEDFPEEGDVPGPAEDVGELVEGEGGVGEAGEGEGELVEAVDGTPGEGEVAADAEEELRGGAEGGGAEGGVEAGIG